MPWYFVDPRLRIGRSWDISHADAFAISASLMMALAAVWLWMRWLDRRLSPSAFTRGYLMLAAVLFLALYNVRKKLPFVPLGSSAAWLQWHIYVGLGSRRFVCACMRDYDGRRAC